MQGAEFDAVGVLRMANIPKELAKRAAQGWELVQAYHEMKYFGPRRHILIFTRKTPTT